MYRRRLAFALAMAALAAILVPSPLPAQITFERTYGGTSDDYGHSVQQTTDGGYIISGLTFSFGAGYSDVYLVKTDANGETLWTKTIGGAGADYGYSVRQTTDSGYIVAGTTESYGAGGGDIYLIKTDANGETLWTRTIGGALKDYGYSVRQTTDSGYAVAGYTDSYGAGYHDVYLVKTGKDGDTAWTRTYGGSDGDVGNSVWQTIDSGYVIVGLTWSFGGGIADVYLIRTDADGNLMWSKAFGGVYGDGGSSVQQTPDGGYIIAGGSNSYGAGDGDVYLIKTDADGDTLWTRTFGGVRVEYGVSIQRTTDGGYIITGGTESYGAGLDDVYLIRTDADGDTLWTRTYGGADYDDGYSVQQTTDGGYIIAGYTRYFGAGGADIYLIKTDSLGNVAVAEPKASPTRAPALSLTCEPNPFRTRTAISLQLTADIPAELAIFDASGRRVRTFTVNRTPCTVWDGTDELGNALPSGTYFAVLAAGGLRATARLVLQR